MVAFWIAPQSRLREFNPYLFETYFGTSELSLISGSWKTEMKKGVNENKQAITSIPVAVFVLRMLSCLIQNDNLGDC